MTTGPSPPPRGVTRQDVFSVLGALGAILTLTTAVMFYFGWRRSAEQSRAMGIDVSLFGFSSQDYVLRSISSLYLPILVLIGLVFGWVWLNSRVAELMRSEWLTSADRRSAAAVWTSSISIGAAAVAAGCVLFAIAAGMSSRPAPVSWLATRLNDRQWVVPVVLVATTLVAGYFRSIHRQLRPSFGEVVPLWQTLLPIALMIATVTLGGFWMLEEYAAAVGRGQAQQIARRVDRLSRAVVISPTPLGIQAPGVSQERLGAVDSPEVRYRTTGLRLLARSGGKVLLVHDGWRPATGTVIVLPDSDELSWQFSR